MSDGYSENVSFVDEVSNGVKTILHFEGDQLTVQRQWDATPWLEAAKAARAATAGERWGDGRVVGYLPPADYGRYLTETRGWTKEERRQWIRAYFQERTGLVTFEKYLKR